MIDQQRQGLYLQKIRQFIARLGGAMLSDSVPLEATFAHSVEPVAFADRLALTYAPISEGQNWGKTWESAWFHLKGTIPGSWAGKCVVAQIEFNSEALVFSADGVPVQGLTNGSVLAPLGDDSARTLLVLCEPAAPERSGTRTTERCVARQVRAAPGDEVELWVEAAANALFGIHTQADPPRDSPKRHGTYQGAVNRMRLCVFEPELWRLWLDMDLLLSVLQAQDEGSTRRLRILRGLSEAVDLYAADAGNAAACREHLRTLLEQPACASTVTAVAVGHAHIDIAWLWPRRESTRKAARTFSSQLDLIERYGEYVFGASQAYLYATMKQTYPALYEKIKAAVAAGRWEAQGAMWVEADCNIISGESMVRQVLHGKNFFRDELGIDVRNLWIPDVFGYSASMPQIMKRAGVDYFLTQKMSWSQFNKFPHTTFRWRGIDGSELLTHFPPENTYNSTLRPESMAAAEKNFRERDVLDEMMVLFGFGDGGGGPKAEHLERGRRQADLEGAPRVKFGTAQGFFDRLEKHRSALPVWSGELYLELHRGTLTTQGRTKRGNRKLELALREAEYLCSCAVRDMAAVKRPPWHPAPYPREALDGLWKTLLVNQFHDIIPGSSIHKVYEQTEGEHAAALAQCQTITSHAAAAMFEKDESAITLVNTLNVPLKQSVVLPAGWDGLTDADGRSAAVQQESDGTVVAAVELAPQGIVTLTKAKGDAAPCRPQGLVLENELVRYELSAEGQVVAAYDKAARREILVAGGRGNVLTLYEDRPNAWDAWDIDIFYEQQVLETARAVALESLGAGPVRQGLRLVLAVGSSRIEQSVYLAAGSKRLDFVTVVDWQERHRMLRTAFAVNVQAESAAFEIQYGYVRRNTHRNVSWDMARFEVAAQRWVDLSDNQYGVALLNDCKYGHKVHENVLDLNLLRSPTHPDPDADQGRHECTYSLLPHEGALIDSDVMDQAAALNQPPLVLPGKRAAAIRPPAYVGGKGVSLAVLKKAEKEDCLVLRLVETRGCRTEATVQLTDAGARLVECDLMEWNDLADLGGPTVCVPLAPFEIRTFTIIKK
ncbi:MAG: glycoside hydrolase family 38 C-terminal domain-containing protein [Planctomycetaceae bacterium]|nr:glycosyl hydrolase-related protein [Planctomycetaceae bacterium]